jgi:polyhydroxyalkanoate synthase subunit PhaC
MEPSSISTTLDDFRRVQFGMNDILRRAQGDAIGAFGLDPRESPYAIIDSRSHWRLRDYGAADGSRSLLVIAAPIKRPYIWDLAPSVSAIHYCLEHGLHVYLLEWMPAAQQTGSNGLDEYVSGIADCVATISGKHAGTKPALIGHSLGGTLAAIFAAWAPQSIRGLVLLDAPLCFQPQQSHFRDALVSLVPSDLPEGQPFPGSLLSHMSALASPETFVWSRAIDAALSLGDHHAMDIHARVERWALDEVALPGKLVHEIIERLYRENCLSRGTLDIRGTRIGPSSLSVPTLAVVNVADQVAPLASIAPFVNAMQTTHVRIIEYAGEHGVCLQHLGILIGRKARSDVWPEITSWLNSRE